MKHFIFFFLFCFFLSGKASQEVDPVTGAPVSETKETKKDKKGWSFFTRINQSKRYHENFDPLSVISFGLRKTIAKKYSLGFSQGLVGKCYVVFNCYAYEGVDPFLIADSKISASYQIGKKYWGFNVGALSFSFSLPISKNSRRQDIRTQTSVGTSITRAFLDKKINVSLSPFVRYLFSKYKTTVTHPGSGGGRPLGGFGFGSRLSASYKYKSVSFNSSFTWTRKYYKSSGYENPNPKWDKELMNPPQHPYAFSLGASYSHKGMSFSIGHTQSNLAERLGGIEIVAFDPEISGFYVSAGYSLSL